MPAKKSNTPGKRTATKGKTSEENRRELAEHIAAILANPETPTILYNDIAESLTTMSSEIGDDFWHSPEMIERDLNAYIASEEKRKGGVRANG